MPQPPDSPATRRPHAVLDARGQSGGWCILRVEKALAALTPGQVLRVMATDPQLPRDLTKVLAQRGDWLEGPLNKADHFVLHVGRGRAGLAGAAKPNHGPHGQKRSEPMSELLSEIPQSAGMVDARGSACPGPLLEAKKGIGRVKVGEVLEVLSNDPGTKDDIPVWAVKVGHEYLGHAEADGCERIFVRRRK